MVLRLLEKRLAPSSCSDSLGARFRRHRLEYFEHLFFNCFDLGCTIRVLDVGGTSRFWQESKLLDFPSIQITLLNIEAEQTVPSSMRSVTGDATAMPEFVDREFDLVFSNSVIEHLYTWDQQQRMAHEVNRVGKKFYIQTPNRYFPIEAHYILPYAQFWPKALLHKTLTGTRLSRFRKWESALAKQYISEIRLLNETEMKSLFPAGKVFREKCIGMTKSITMHNLV